MYMNVVTQKLIECTNSSQIGGSNG